jgi:hypothetical protein
VEEEDEEARVLWGDIISSVGTPNDRGVFFWEQLLVPLILHLVVMGFLIGVAMPKI